MVKNKSKTIIEDVDKMVFLNCVIREALRSHPPAPLLVPRETSTSVNLRGYDILLKTAVYVNAWAIQRNKGCEKEQEFLPQRFTNCTVDFKGQYFEFILFSDGR